MSKLGCICGAIISDTADKLAYKARLLKDTNSEVFFDWMTNEISSYVDAAVDGKATEWLQKKGFGDEYAAMNLSHGDVLHDHIHTKFLEITRDIYECEKCGRIHIEKNVDNHFSSYTPDSRKLNRALAK